MYTANNIKNMATFLDGATITISKVAFKTQLIELLGAILVKCIFATPKIFLISSSNNKHKS